MPRHRRIDVAGAIHHVIVRGIERRRIFRDNVDRQELLGRLEKALGETDCICYAWVLMPNHFHLLIRTGPESLSSLMRKVLTGYAVYHNKRHRRHGYLYQNRYKSILCQEEAYFLELVRYIHLNPVRLGLVKGMGELDRYKWSGHSTLVGRHKRRWQKTDEVLARFGKSKKMAVEKYREFIRDGLKMENRPELAGGRLRRSAGGWEGISALRKAKEYWRGDERLLGDEEFVDKVLKAAEENLSRKERLIRDGWNLDMISEKVCAHFRIGREDLIRRGRQNAVSSARAVVCYLAGKELGLTGTEIGRYLGISRVAVSKAMGRGEKYAKEARLKLLS